LRTTIIAFFLLLASLASASIVSVVSPVNKSFDSRESNAVLDLGSLPGGAIVSLSFSRDAGEGKKWDYAIPVEAFRPSGWTVQQSTRDSLLVASFASTPSSNGSYLLKVMLVDSDEGLLPQTVSFKATMTPTSVLAATPIVSQAPAPAPPVDWEMVLIVLSVLGVLAFLVATFYFTAPARKRVRAEEERRRKELKERLAKRAPPPVVLPTKKIIVVEEEKRVEKPAAPAQEKFVLKQAAPPSMMERKPSEIEVPLRKIVSEQTPKKTVAAEAMKELSLDQLKPKESTQEVLRDIDAVLEELKPKYGLKQGEKEKKR